MVVVSSNRDGIGIAILWSAMSPPRPLALAALLAALSACSAPTTLTSMTSLLLGGHPRGGAGATAPAARAAPSLFAAADDDADGGGEREEDEDEDDEAAAKKKRSRDDQALPKVPPLSSVMMLIFRSCAPHTDEMHSSRQERRTVTHTHQKEADHDLSGDVCDDAKHGRCRRARARVSRGPARRSRSKGSRSVRRGRGPYIYMLRHDMSRFEGIEARTIAPPPSFISTFLREEAETANNRDASDDLSDARANHHHQHQSTP